MQQREVMDERGRTWVGSITSGTVRGGEKRAEVVFVCKDQPSELKRVGHLELPPAEAATVWHDMRPDEVLDILERSEPA